MYSVNRMRAGVAALIAAAGFGVGASPAAANDLLWIRQEGTPADDYAYGVAADASGNAYVVGSTLAGIGTNNIGLQDGFVLKVDPDRQVVWALQPGTVEWDLASGVATGADGTLVVVGQTAGALAGANKGNEDAWVIKVDVDGHLLWQRQPGSGFYDSARAVAVDASGNVFVAGVTQGALGGAKKGGYDDADAFVIKFDRDGGVLWRRQPGTAGRDEATGVASDPDGNIYVVGTTQGALVGTAKGHEDAFVIKFDADGRYLWKRQPGTAGNDRATGVATDADGNVYVVGSTEGALGGRGTILHRKTDAWVFKYDGNGSVLWKRQPGTNGEDTATAVAVDATGNVSVVGNTTHTLGGVHFGSSDAWGWTFDAAGTALTKWQFGTQGSEVASGVTIDATGIVYMTGSTDSTLFPGGYNGGWDTYLVRYVP